MQFRIFNRLLSVELINGCGLWLEFSDSRAVWVYNTREEETYAMPFVGVFLCLPFVMISFGNVYTIDEN